MIFSHSVCVTAAAFLYAAGRDAAKIQRPGTAALCVRGVCESKTQRTRWERARTNQGFPKDWNNKGIDGFTREEIRFLKDRENKVLKQKLKKSKG